MEFKKEEGRIFRTDEAGKVLAEITFPDAGAGAVVIDHTFVDGALRGQGAAAALMEAAYEEIKASGKKAFATCSYAVKWFGEHPEKQDILLEE
jgi:predicted GNAT family acetyltransferase